MKRLLTTKIRYESVQLFALIAQLGSIAAAARQLGMGTSAATRHLMGLESALSVRLFNRSTRSLELTEAGQRALDWAIEATTSLEKVSEDLAALAGTPAGHIRLGVPHFGMNTYMPEVLGAFTARYPDISLDITTSDEVANLIGEKFDVALRYGILPDSRNVAVRITEFERVLCASPRYLDNFGFPETLSDLAHHHCIVHRPTDARTWAFERDGKLFHQPVRARYTVDNSFSLERLALEHVGVTRLPTATIRSSVANGKLVRLLPEFRCMEPSGDRPSIWLVSAGRLLPYSVRLLVDHLKAQLPAARRRYNSELP